MHMLDIVFMLYYYDTAWFYELWVTIWRMISSFVKWFSVYRYNERSQLIYLDVTYKTYVSCYIAMTLNDIIMTYDLLLGE